MSDELSKSARQVVEAVQSASRPVAADRVRGWEALQRQIPVDLGSLGPSDWAAATPAKAAGLGKLLGAAAAVMAVAGASALWLAPRAASDAPAPMPVVVGAPTGEPPLPPPAASVTGAVAPQSPLLVAPKPLASVKPTAPSLAEDAELLYAARAAFQSGDLGSASRKLQEHARAFPTSQLRSARSLLRVKVLCGLGQRQAALDEAERLRRTAPKSSESTGLASTCAAK